MGIEESGNRGGQKPKRVRGPFGGVLGTEDSVARVAFGGQGTAPNHEFPKAATRTSDIRHLGAFRRLAQGLVNPNSRVELRNLCLTSPTGRLRGRRKAELQPWAPGGTCLDGTGRAAGLGEVRVRVLFTELSSLRLLEAEYGCGCSWEVRVLGVGAQNSAKQANAKRTGSFPGQDPSCLRTQHPCFDP